MDRFLQFSVQKYSSNVIQKCLSQYWIEPVELIK